MSADHVTLERILQLGPGFRASRTLVSAVELGVFTLLADGPRSGKPVREELGLHPRGADDFLDALVSPGMLERAGDEYADTPATGLFLDRDKPSYVGGILEMANARLHPFRGGADRGAADRPAAERAHGRGGLLRRPVPGARPAASLPSTR